MDGSGPPPFDGITETPYETPTAEELAQLEELGPQWYAEAGLESGAEAATIGLVDRLIEGLKPR